MSRTSFGVIVLVAGLIGASTATAAAGPADQAAPCTLQQETLSTGNRVAGASIKNAGPNGYLVGLLAPQDQSKALPVVWHNKVPTVLPDVPGWYPYPQAVNGRGDVAGFLTPVGDPNGAEKAFVNRGGTYTILPSPNSVNAWATNINGAGDVVGHMRSDPTATPQLVLWPAAAPQTYRVVTTGWAVGFDDAGRIITFDGRIIAPDGSVARIAGSANDKVERFAGGRLVGGIIGGTGDRKEWNINGAYVRDIPGYQTIAVSPTGLVDTWYRIPFMGENPRLTDASGQFVSWAPWDAIGLTDRDELFGTIHTTTDPFVLPTVWACAAG